MSRPRARQQRPTRRDPAHVARELEALYARIPRIDCAGRCHDSCGPIHLTSAEQARIAAQGVTIPSQSYQKVGPVRCPALSIFNRCTVYAVRPLVCRLWGLMEWLPCTYGCTPTDGPLLTPREGYTLIAEVYAISGDHGSAREFRRLAAGPPEFLARMGPIMREYTAGRLTDAGVRAAMAAAGLQPLD